MASLALSSLAAARQTVPQAASGPQAKVEVKSKAAATAEQAKPAAKPAAKKAEATRTEPVVPAYSDIRQRSATPVFYVWLWFSIAVLVYFLRQWIKEADRIYMAKYYEPEDSPRKGNPIPPALGE
jgi:hypothetical protein